MKGVGSLFIEAVYAIDTPEPCSGRSCLSRLEPPRWPLAKPPRFNDVLRRSQRSELVPVHALFPQSPITRLNECVFHGFAGSRESRERVKSCIDTFALAYLNQRHIVHGGWCEP